MKNFVAILMVVLVGGFVAWFSWKGDGHFLQILLRQHEAESFPHVQGEILSGKVGTYTTRKGRIYYHASFNYRYVVNGQSVQGWRYRYDGHPDDEAAVKAIVDAHPRGSTVEVYYNPKDPLDAVLSPAVDAEDVILPLILSALSLFLLWPLVGMVGALRWGGPQVAGGVKMVTEIPVTRLRMPRFQPLPVAILTMAALYLVAAGAVAYVFPLTPPWAAWQWSLAGVLSAGAAVYLWRFWKAHSGREDLVIDDGARTVQLPLNYKRRGRAPVPFSEIRAVVLNKVRHQRKYGYYYSYMVTLELQDESQQKLIDLGQERAESLAAWLREKLGLPGAM